MIKTSINYYLKLSEGILRYPGFLNALKNDVALTKQEEISIRDYVNQALFRHFRNKYILENMALPLLSPFTIAALGIYNALAQANISGLTYEQLLEQIAPNEQLIIEEHLPASDFPLKIPQQLQLDAPNTHLAARFSVPVFLIDQLITDVGFKTTVKLLSNRYRPQSGIVNLSEKDIPTFFKEHESLRQEANSNVFSYKGFQAIKNHPAYLKNEIIVVSKSLQEVNDVIKSLNVKTLLFSQFADTSFLVLLAVTNPNVTIYFTAVEPKTQFVLRHLSKKFELSNVKYITKIENNFPLVITTLDSSMINGDVRNRDFYLTLDPALSKFADLAQEQLSQMKEYVAPSGHLLFISATVLRKETHYQALTLLKDSEDYTLIKEKQYFHYRPGFETLYYALLTKRAHEQT